MKKVNLTDAAASMIDSLRSFDTKEIKKSNVADSLSSLSLLIASGRDCEEIASFTNDLLRVMETLADYNEWIDCLYADSDKQLENIKYNYDINDKK